MRVIYKVTNGIASDIQYLQNGAALPKGFQETSDLKPHSPKDLSDTVAWEAQEQSAADLVEIKALQEEALGYFTRGEPFPKDKADRAKALHDRRAQA